MKKLISGCILFCLAAVLVLLPASVLAEVRTPEDLAEGSYHMEVTLSGGTGRASITSPAAIEVQDGSAIVSIEWSSPHYDYMIVDGETYLPVNTEGNSVFEIPLDTFADPLEVIADTTAMSVPHEISYTLQFDPQTLQSDSGHTGVSALVIAAIAALCVVCAVVIRKRKN